MEWYYKVYKLAKTFVDKLNKSLIFLGNAKVVASNSPFNVRFPETQSLNDGMNRNGFFFPKIGFRILEMVSEVIKYLKTYIIIIRRKNKIDSTILEFTVYCHEHHLYRASETSLYIQTKETVLNNSQKL